ncbi:MAG: hypothetical protein QXE01_10400 [Sulfolobales archaeon]
MASSKGFDLYMLAGISVLGIASAVLLLIIIHSWRTVFSAQPIYYPIAILAVSLIPLALMVITLLFDIGFTPFKRLPMLVTRKREIPAGEEEIETRSVEASASIGEAAIAIAVPSNKGSGVKEVEATPVYRQAGDASLDSGQKAAGSSPGSIEADIAGIVKEEVSKAVSNVTSTVNRISEEIEKIKKEFEETKAVIEEGMMDIRTLLSEISNPFNYMRRFMSELELGEMGIKGGRIAKTEVASVSEGEQGGGGHRASEIREAIAKPSLTSNAISVSSLGENLAELLIGKTDIAKLMRLVIFVGDNLPKLGREGLLGLVELGVASGVLPKDSMHLIAKIVSLIESSRVPPKRLAITIYELARSMGVYDKEAEFLSAALSGV